MSDSDTTEETSGGSAGRTFILGAMICSVLLMVGLVAFVRYFPAGEPQRFELFLGRLHPLLVHLPIGVLLLAGILDGIGWLFPSLRSDPFLLLVLVIGFLTGVASVLAGFFLALTGGYDASYLFWHKWMGVGVVVASGLSFVCGGLYYLLRSTFFLFLYRLFLILMVATLAGAGHYGGTLTHGPGYLTEYMPAPVKQWVGLKSTASKPTRSGKIANIQGAQIYGDLVRPIMEDHCVSCHGASKKKGELRLDKKKFILEGGENGKVLKPGRPDQSDLYRRVTLPLYHEDVMPPDTKEPLTVGETELIRWWIQTGSSFQKKVKSVEEDDIPLSVQTVLNRLRKKTETRQTGIYALDLNPPEKEAVQQLTASSDWEVSFLSQATRFLEVYPKRGFKGKIDRSVMAQLKPVRKTVAWLRLNNRDLTDSAWAYLEQLPNLTRVHLQQSNVADEHLAHLKKHKYMTYLNLYNTAVTDSGMKHLMNLKSLNALYLWGTDVTKKKAEQLRKKIPNLSVNRGILQKN